MTRLARNVWTLEDSTGLRWGTLTAARILRPALTFLAALVAVVALWRADAQGAQWPGLVVLLWAVAAAARPDGFHGLVTLVVYAAAWLGSEVPETSPWALVGALAMLAFHALLAESAGGRRGQVDDPVVVRRWLRDCLVVAAVTVTVWAVVGGLHERVGSSQALLGVVLLAVAGLVWHARGDS